MIFGTLPTSDHPEVVLRPIAVADLPAWFAYLTQPRVYEHTSWNVASIDDLAHYATGTVGPDSAMRLAICTRSRGELAGTIGFHSVSGRDRRAEIAYDLAPGLWGRGIATAMVRVLTRWAHCEAGIRRVQATALVSNARSRAVLGRCGFAFEGILRDYRTVRGTPGDFAMYAHREAREIPA